MNIGPVEPDLLFWARCTLFSRSPDAAVDRIKMLNVFLQLQPGGGSSGQGRQAASITRRSDVCARSFSVVILILRHKCGAMAVFTLLSVGSFVNVGGAIWAC